MSELSDDDLKLEIRTIHTVAETSEYSFLVDELPCLSSKFPNMAIRDEFAGVLVEYKRKRRKALRLFPGVMKTLEKLKSSGVKLVAYTESMEYHTVERLKVLGLDGVIDHLYSRDDHASPAHIEKVRLRTEPDENYALANTRHTKLEISNRKPATEILERIIAECGVDKSQCLYVGDSPMKDIAMANACGITSVLITHPNSKLNDERYELLRSVTHWTDAEVSDEKIVTPTPTHTISTFAELLALFDFGLARSVSPEVLTVWEKTIEVQMHFNDIQLRIRSLYASVMVGIVGATGAVIATVEDPSFEIGNLSFHFVFIAIFAILLSNALFYMMDRHWYHRFLQGAVMNAVKIEKEFGSVLAGIRLSHEISYKSKFSFAKFSFIYFATFALRKVRGQYLRDSLEISSDDRLEIFYRGIYKPAVILLGVTFFCGGLKYDGAAIYELVLNLLPFEGTHGYFGG